MNEQHRINQRDFLNGCALSLAAGTSTSERPAVTAKKKFGQIANADAVASPHTDAAINEAYRAVSELSKS